MTNPTPSTVYDNCANEVDYLCDHLRSVIDKIYNGRNIEAGIELANLRYRLLETSERWYQKASELEQEEERE